jgi:hypothetical protein
MGSGASAEPLPQYFCLTCRVHFVVTSYSFVPDEGPACPQCRSSSAVERRELPPFVQEQRRAEHQRQQQEDLQRFGGVDGLITMLMRVQLARADGADIETALRDSFAAFEEAGGAPDPTPEDVIKALPLVKIENDGQECAVCLDEIEVGGEGTCLPCSHKYHPACIVPWLRLHSTCPICRDKVVESGTAATSSSGDSTPTQRSASASTTTPTTPPPPHHHPNFV